jgi:hypothetical protein
VILERKSPGLKETGAFLILLHQRDMGGCLIAPVASVTARAASLPSTSSAHATATGAVCARPSQIHFERAATQLAAIEHTDGFFSVGLGRHFDKAEPFGASRVAICDDGCRCDWAGLAKDLPQIFFRRLVRKIADV